MACAIGLGLLFLLLGLGLIGELAAQGPAKKPRVEEEEEPVPARPKVARRVEDSDPGGLPVNLFKEAEKAKDSALQALFRRLAVPHDEIHAPLPGDSAWVEPLPRYLSGKGLKEDLTARRLDRKGEEKTWRRSPLVEVVPYEELAVRQVEDFLAKLPKTGSVRLALLQGAEQALQEVLRFHETARERGQRQGSGWDKAGQALKAKLLEVRLLQLHSLMEARQLSAARNLAQRLTHTDAHEAQVRTAVIQLCGQEAEQLLQKNSSDAYVQVRLLLEQVERQFPGSQEATALQPIRSRLQSKARAHVQQAEALQAKDRAQAIEQLHLAESTWPQLPELHRLRQTLGLDSVLYVGVRQLPTWLSPATAAADEEKLALDLLFESLVRPVLDPITGQGYEPVLAASSPQLIPQGRQFQLVPDARWYRPGRTPNEPALDRELTAADVRHTLQLYQGASKQGRGAPQWRELLDDARTVGGDPFRLRLTLQQGFFEPLALMSFKVLPPHLTDLHDPNFARQPVGSGPYVYHGRESRHLRPGEPAVVCAVFRANPTYGSRLGKSGRPYIREICMVPMPGRDARQDFRADKTNGWHLHLLLDLPTRQIKELESPQAGLRDVQVQTLRNRRVYFLAVNQRQPLLQNETLRRALALAIDRDQVLNRCFRDSQADGRRLHRPLNSPYLPGTWACDPKLPLDPFHADMARTLAARLQQGNAMPRLELKYPAAMPSVREACDQLRSQVQEITGISLDLKPCSIAELRQAVEVDHDYQLAYWWWDHADESYWLWPLFDPASTGPGGSNFLGACHDSQLEDFFRHVQVHREFREVQRWTHLIHKRLYDTMPLIPLWQLDTHLAIHNRVQTVPPPERLEAPFLFTHVELWRLGK